MGELNSSQQTRGSPKHDGDTAASLAPEGLGLSSLEKTISGETSQLSRAA